MSIFKVTTASVITLFVICSCTTQQKKITRSVDENSWQAQMHIMSTTLQQLTPYIYSQEAFRDPKNFKFIDENLTHLQKTVTEFKKIPRELYPEQDPVLKVMLSRLHSDVRSARQSFAQNDYPFASTNIKNITQYCFFCHTRRANGSRLHFSSDDEALSNVGPIEKGEFFVATRQFRKAKEVLREVLFQEEDHSDPFRKERALKKLLLVELRTGSNIKNAITSASQYKLTSNAPQQLKQTITSWEKDLERWKDESTPYTLSGLEDMIDDADSRKAYFFDESVNVTFLLASRKLHDLLATAQTQEQRAKTYFLLGRSYEVLKDSGLWNLNEIYYESCIRTAEQSFLAKKCYQRLAESISIGFSGSGGYFIPATVRNYLKKMKSMAFKLEEK